jgi:hypothetical protein
MAGTREKEGIASVVVTDCMGHLSQIRHQVFFKSVENENHFQIMGTYVLEMNVTVN